jgi:hypothetical protein
LCTLTPRRFANESRPRRVEPPAFLCDIVFLLVLSEVIIQYKRLLVKRLLVV